MTMCQVTSLASVFWPFVCPLVAAVAYPVIFLSMQQSVCAGYIGFVAGRRELGVHQARLAIDFYVALHAKVPLVAFLACAHLRGVLYNASSMARPERLKHCCRTWMRSMVSIANEEAPRGLDWAVGRNACHQLTPGHHQPHLIEKLTLARAFGLHFKPTARLICFMRQSSHAGMRGTASFAEFP